MASLKSLLRSFCNSLIRFYPFISSGSKSSILLASSSSMSPLLSFSSSSSEELYCSKIFLIISTDNSFFIAYYDLFEELEKLEAPEVFIFLSLSSYRPRLPLRTLPYKKFGYSLIYFPIFASPPPPSRPSAPASLFPFPLLSYLYLFNAFSKIIKRSLYLCLLK